MQLSESELSFDIILLLGYAILLARYCLVVRSENATRARL